MNSATQPALKLVDTLGEYIAPMSSRHWATHFSQPQHRSGVLAVYCFAHLMDGLCLASPDVIAEKSVWWHDELQRLEQQDARHPITRALQSHLSTQTYVNAAGIKELYQQLHLNLHGALMTQQKIGISTFEDWQEYAHMRMGSIYCCTNILGGKSSEPAIEHGRWAGQISLLGCHRSPKLITDSGMIASVTGTGFDQTPQAIESKFEALMQQRPINGSVASEIAIYHDINWWRKIATEVVPSLTHQSLGLKGLMSSWRVARKFR